MPISGDITFDTYINHLLDGTTDFATLTVRGMLVDSLTWTPSKSDGFVATALAAGAVEVTASPYARQTLGGKTRTLDTPGHRVLLDGNLLDFGAMAAAQNYDALILFAFVTNDADSWLMAAFDLGAQTTNGVQQRFVPNADGFWEVLAP